MTVLIGENNSGKTSVLDALKLCLRDLGPRRRVVFDALDYHLSDSVRHRKKQKTRHRPPRSPSRWRVVERPE